MNATPDFGPMGKTWGSYGPSLLYSQLFTWIPAPNHDFSGQTVIVTGSNTGIGLEAARILVQLNAAKVILAVRTVSKGEAAAEDIIRTTRATRNRLEVWQLDISNPDSIKKFVAKAQKLDRLDAVIQNAGVLSAKWSTINGVESHIAVNVIGASLFGLQILPKMRESAKKHNSRGRLTFVGSDTQYVALWKEQYYAGSLLDNLSDERMADIDDRYPLSKLLLLYSVREIAARNPLSADSNVIVNFQTPGLCWSDLFRDEQSWIAKMGFSFAMLIFSRSTTSGARTYIDAIRPNLEPEAHGAFLMDLKIADNGPSVESPRGQKLAKQFTTELFDRLETIAPGVTKGLR